MGVNSGKWQKRLSVKAKRGGRSSGRDMYNAPGAHVDNRQGLFFEAASELTPPPLAGSPNLHDCPHCGRPFLSRRALFCPTCGYSVQMADDQRKRARQFRWELTIVAGGLGPLALILQPEYPETTMEKIQYSMGTTMVGMSAVMLCFAAYYWWRVWRERKEGN